MKTFRTISIRLLTGILCLALLITALFKVTLLSIPTWGATKAEVALSLPGDELTTNPDLLWTNAITIDASPEDVWPWIAQIGDDRGGFYSYTFIENKVGELMGDAGYDVTYTNANEVHPEWQHPQPDLPIIQKSLKIREYKPGEYMLADSIQPSPFLWIWGWYLQPTDEGTTRLLCRFAIDVPETAGENPVMDFMLNLGGFVMQQNMLQSIKLRAEGGTEPAWIESVEIVLWFVALLSGLAAGVLYIIRKDWRKPLAVALVAVVIIFVLTFVQPSILIRVLLDAGLVTAMVWSARKN